MDKNEALEIVENAKKKDHAIRNIDLVQNEHADGYYRDLVHGLNAIKQINEAGYDYVDGAIYDKADFDAMRKTWNDAVKSASDQKRAVTAQDMIDLETLTGIKLTTLKTLKNTFGK